MTSRALWIALSCLAISLHADQEIIGGRDSVVLRSPKGRVVFDLGGGALREFTQAGSDLNPLGWNTPRLNDVSVHGFGHFLCLDRWGPPSEAEGKRGMPYHGEASNVRWTVDSDSREEAVMSAHLPKAGLTVRRTIKVSAGATAFSVREEVTNENQLGRVLNIVQHPTIAPPFLDETTIVDCNGQKGFAQGGSLPTPEEPSFEWPAAVKKSGETVNLRVLKNDPDPNVVSYAIEEQLGWVTAANPEKGLLIGYIWRTRDYPWVSLWRDVRDGKPAARGLEFGSTGLHQPFPTLLKKGRIWDRPLFEYLDAGERLSKGYICFQLNIPKAFTGVQSIRLEGDKLSILTRHGEKAGESKEEMTIPLGNLSRDL